MKMQCSVWVWGRNTCIPCFRKYSSNVTSRGTNIIKLNEKSAKKDEKIAKKLKPSSLGLLAIPVAAFGLGVWQTKRLKWKEGLIAHLKDQVLQEAIPFPSRFVTHLQV
uniref:SURF1-like protein n=1 Tax=Bursaphelenchus xylophilus TaxID=6326 RepID=A0A1I7SMH6_BURXY